MPELLYIESDLYVEDDSTSYYEVYFGLLETPGLGDGYFGIDYLKGSEQLNVIQTGGWTDDEFSDGQVFDGLTVSDRHHQLGDTIILEIHSVGKKATDYFQSISSEVFRDGLLDPPPVNVTTNFSNGGVGYFITSGKRSYEIVIE